MAFAYLPESVALNKDSITYFQPSDQSFTLKGKYLQFQSFKQICEEESYPLHPYFPTLNPSCPSLITSIKKWISSQEVSPVNPIHQPADESQRMITAGSGITLLKPFAYVHLPTSSLRMFQTSLLNPMQHIPFSQPLPKRGSMLNGQLYERQPLAQTITETDSSSLPIFHLNSKESNNKRPIQTQIIPTPTVIDMEMKPQSLRTITVDNLKKSKSRGISLSNFGHLLLPTPTTSDGERASNYYGTGNLTLQGSLTDSPQNGSQGLRLNPLFVEWMMGFPPNFTDYARSETPLFPFKHPTPSII